MATTDVFIISSSPPRQLVSYDTSSPPLPSLDEMFNEKKASNLQRGSGFPPIPTGATTTFASVSTLLRKSSSGSLQGFDNARSFGTTAVQDGNDSKKSAKPKAPRKTATKKEDGTVEKVAKASRKTAKKKDQDVAGVAVEEIVEEAAEIVAENKPRKPRAKKGDDAEGKGGSVAEATVLGPTDAAVEKKPRKPRAKKGDDATGEGVKEKVPRKPRAKKTDVEAGSETVPKEKAVRKPRAKKSDVDSNLQPKMVKGRVTKSANASNTNKVENPKADTVSKHFAPSPIVGDIVAEEGFGLVEAIKRRTNWTPPKPTQIPIDLEDSPEARGSDTNKGFAELLGSFGFSSNEANSIEKRISSGVSNGAAATRKRKLIEMVTTNIPTVPGSKATKEKAVKKKARTLTDLATSAYATAEEDDDDSLLDAPAPLLQYFPHAAPGEFTNGGFKIPPKPRSKSPVKGVQKSRKGSAEEPILLSPESALKQVSNQDFVFGTSSQLAREDSPSLLRDLHDAMQASNELDDYDDPFVSPPTKIAERGKAVVAAKRNLWSVAARDDHGDLMDIETIDLAHTPVAKPDRIMLSQKPSSSLVTPAKDEWFDIDEIEDNRPPSTQVPAREMGPIERSINLQLLNSPIQPKNTSKDTFKQKKGTKCSVAKSTNLQKTEAFKMPDYESFTTPQLTREIQKYKFKQIKSRKKMIDLLVQCYESQNRPALGVLQGNIPIAAQNPLERSKDGASSSTQAEPTIPSPPRRSASQIRKSSKALELSPADDNQDDEAQQAQLFAHIYTAIINAPPSQDPSNPSWHEKILLYDPIVLEDLASWLNTGALGKVGWDGEVAPKEVKKWCESKSICCLWRENHGGLARSRY
ncbi:hypothetical protein EAF04_010786 [Stromatinia cepivora]|nr:hypothetical protein EAF04_010786 [Stromatinia cepivora]